MANDEAPLSGCEVVVSRSPRLELKVAATILAELGASVDWGSTVGGGIELRCRPRGTEAEVRVEHFEFEAGELPPGALEFASGLCAVLAASAGLVAGGELVVDPAAVAAYLLLEEVAAKQPPNRMVRSPVRTGNGFVWADLPTTEDEELFASLLQDRPAREWSNGSLAATAQSIGLAVLDFEPWHPRPAGLPVADLEAGPFVTGGSASVPGVPLAGAKVADMTTMWAGPLATALLADLGAEVNKIEPECRRDGTREIPGVFFALNRGKQKLDLDLRDAKDHDRMNWLLADSDFLVMNSAPRVARNLNLEPGTLFRNRSRPLLHLAMPAFPRGSPQRSWRSYGRGIHAAAGLGMTTKGEPWAPLSPYCDILTGFAAAAVAVALRVRSDRSRSAEVPMLNVAARLAEISRPVHAIPVPDEAGSRLVAEHGDRATQLVETVGGHFRVPRSPLSSSGVGASGRDGNLAVRS